MQCRNEGFWHQLGVNAFASPRIIVKRFHSKTEQHCNDTACKNSVLDSHVARLNICLSHQSEAIMTKQINFLFAIEFLHFTGLYFKW